MTLGLNPIQYEGGGGSMKPLENVFLQPERFEIEQRNFLTFP